MQQDAGRNAGRHPCRLYLSSFVLQCVFDHNLIWFVSCTRYTCNIWCSMHDGGGDGGAVCVRMCAYHAKMRFGISPPTRVLSISLLNLGDCANMRLCAAWRVFIIIAYSVIYDHRQRALSAYLLCGGGAMGEMERGGRRKDWSCGGASKQGDRVEQFNLQSDCEFSRIASARVCVCIIPCRWLMADDFRKELKKR